jgi:hypothetical protein
MFCPDQLVVRDKFGQKPPFIFDPGQDTEKVNRLGEPLAVDQCTIWESSVEEAYQVIPQLAPEVKEGFCKHIFGAPIFSRTILPFPDAHPLAQQGERGSR